MTKTKVVIYGLGDFALVAHAYLTGDQRYEVVAFTADKKEIISPELFQLPVIPFEEIEHHYPPSSYHMLVAIGYKKLNQLRAEKYYQAKQKGYQLISYIHPTVYLWDNVKVGDNCFILENVVLQPFVEIGANVVLWSGSNISHHSVIKDHCFIAPAVVIASHVTVGQYCFLGINSTIRDQLVIAQKCIIGAGSVVVKDTLEKGVYAGSPARLTASDSTIINL